MWLREYDPKLLELYNISYTKNKRMLGSWFFGTWLKEKEIVVDIVFERISSNDERGNPERAFRRFMRKIRKVELERTSEYSDGGSDDNESLDSDDSDSVEYDDSELVQSDRSESVESDRSESLESGDCEYDQIIKEVNRCFQAQLGSGPVKSEPQESEYDRVIQEVNRCLQAQLGSKTVNSEPQESEYDRVIKEVNRSLQTQLGSKTLKSEPKDYGSDGKLEAYSCGKLEQTDLEYKQLISEIYYLFSHPIPSYTHTLPLALTYEGRDKLPKSLKESFKSFKQRMRKTFSRVQRAVSKKS